MTPLSQPLMKAGFHKPKFWVISALERNHSQMLDQPHILSWLKCLVLAYSNLWSWKWFSSSVKLKYDKKSILLSLSKRQNQLVKRNTELVCRSQWTKTMTTFLIRQKPAKSWENCSTTEPVTSLSAVECSTTEPHPLVYNKAMKFLLLASESWLNVTLVDRE